MNTLTNYISCLALSDLMTKQVVEEIIAKNPNDILRTLRDRVGEERLDYPSQQEFINTLLMVYEEDNL